MIVDLCLWTYACGHMLVDLCVWTYVCRPALVGICMYALFFVCNRVTILSLDLVSASRASHKKIAANTSYICSLQANVHVAANAAHRIRAGVYIYIGIYIYSSHQAPYIYTCIHTVTLDPPL